MKDRLDDLLGGLNRFLARDQNVGHVIEMRAQWHSRIGILFTDLAVRAGMHGIQEWLSFYWKSPMVREGLYPENDLFVQRSKLLNTLRYLMRAELIHHTGLDYYYDLDEK